MTQYNAMGKMAVHEEETAFLSDAREIERSAHASSAFIEGEMHHSPTHVTHDIDDEEVEHLPAHIQMGRLLDKLGILWLSRYRLAGATAAVMLIVFPALFLIPNHYTATAVLNPPDMNPVSGLALLGAMKDGDLSSGLSSKMGSVLGISSEGDVYIRMMETHRIEDALIQKFKLQQVYRTNNMEQTRHALEAASTFSVDRKSSAIEIKVTDDNPMRASQLANAYADELQKLNATLSSNAGRQEMEYFESQLELAENDLQAATERLSQYGRKNAALDIDSGAKGIADALGRLQGQIIASEAELRGLRTVYADDNQQVKAMEAQIAELKQQMAQMGGPAKITAQGQSVAGQDDQPSLAHLWGTAPFYLDLAGQVKLKAAIVDTLAQQFELAKLQESNRISDIQLLDPAQPPLKKSGPHRALITLAVGLLVFFGLCGWILMKNWWVNTSLDDPWRGLLSTRIPLLAKMLSKGGLALSPSAESRAEEAGSLTHQS